MFGQGHMPSQTCNNPNCAGTVYEIGSWGGSRQKWEGQCTTNGNRSIRVGTLKPSAELRSIESHSEVLKRKCTSLGLLWLQLWLWLGCILLLCPCLRAMDKGKCAYHKPYYLLLDMFSIDATCNASFCCCIC